MFDYSKLRGKITECGMTQKSFSEAIGVSAVSLSKKLNNEVGFKQEEMKKAVEVLGIEPQNISAYFFALKVQETEL